MKISVCEKLDLAAADCHQKLLFAPKRSVALGALSMTHCDNGKNMT